jgi:hypothetical protein
MRLTLLAGVAALSLAGVAGAQAETIYTTNGYTTGAAVVATDPDVVVTQPNVVAVPAPPFGPFTPQYVVTQPSVVAAPAVAPREQVIERERIVEPLRRNGTVRERIIERERVVAPRAPLAARERVVVAPESRTIVQPAVAPTVVTTGSSTSRSCFIDLNGFERCY